MKLKDKDLVRIARAIRGWEQKELAEIIKVSPSFICKIESGVKSLPKHRREFFIEIIKVFKKSKLNK